MRLRVLFFLILIPFAGLLRADAPPASSLDGLADVPVPLAEALRKFGHDVEHWACTQHEVRYDKDGRVHEDWVARYDPSLPYEEQWTLLKKDGKDPTERQAASYRKEHAKHAKDRKSLGELLDLSKTSVREETPDTLTYEVPLRAEGNDRLPPDKFQVIIVVDRARHEFRSIEVKLRAPMRVALVGKIKQAGGLLTFSSVDSKYAPPVTAVKAAGSGTFLMIPIAASYEVSRTEFKRVKPWSDRFSVKLGPMKVLDF